jgi:hypothetical protein
MPHWPARMNAGMAADYLGVSLTTFLIRVASSEYPQPVAEGKRKLWAKRQLDLYVDAQFGIANREQDDPTWADLK